MLTRTLDTGIVTDRHPLRRIVLFLAAAAVTIMVAVALLTIPGSVPDTVTETVVAPSRSSSSTAGTTARGAGDGCALRLAVGGGFLEGIDSPNGCGQPGGHEVRGGIEP